jgi:uncharacterized protein (DUF305 family)
MAAAYRLSGREESEPREAAVTPRARRGARRARGRVRPPPPPAAPAPAAAPSTPVAPAASAGAARRGYTEADARFLQGMIPHHAQALAMVALVPDRTDRREIRLVAERIEVSQKDEIAAMRGWLEQRGEAAPDPSGHHGHHGAAGDSLMPGMLSAEEMERLASARGADFDRLFLESMIRHHEGALTMVAALLATPGAAQESQLYGIVADVDADQRAEIRRMRGLLATLPGGGSRPPPGAPR